jgi:hypothetical protein
MSVNNGSVKYRRNLMYFHQIILIQFPCVQSSHGSFLVTQAHIQ